MPVHAPQHSCNKIKFLLPGGARKGLGALPWRRRRALQEGWQRLPSPMHQIDGCARFGPLPRANRAGCIVAALSAGLRRQSWHSLLPFPYSPPPSRPPPPPEASPATFPTPGCFDRLLGQAPPLRQPQQSQVLPRSPGETSSGEHHQGGGGPAAGGTVAWGLTLRHPLEGLLLGQPAPHLCGQRVGGRRNGAWLRLPTADQTRAMRLVQAKDHDS